jgi:hypothetical protein
VAQQLSETKKQVDGLQEANQRSVQSLENLEAAVERLNTASTASASARSAKGGTTAVATKSLGEQDLSSSVKQSGNPVDVLTSTVTSGHSQATGEIGSPPFPTAKNVQEEEPSSAMKKEAGATATSVSCSQVWKQLGQGRSPEAAARALGVQVAVIHACEQKIGRSGAAGR